MMQRKSKKHAIYAIILVTKGNTAYTIQRDVICMCSHNKENIKYSKGDEDMEAVKPIHPTRISAITKEDCIKFIKIAEDQSEPSEYVKSVIERYREGKNAKRTK